MQCPSCHNEVASQSTFCGYCGNPLQAAAAGYAPVGGDYTSVPPSGVPTPPVMAGGLSENAAAAIAYITIIPAIIFLVLEPYNRMRLVRFHAIQNLALHVVGVAIWMVLFALQIVHIIPVVGTLVGLLLLLLYPVVSLVFFIVWLLCIFKAAKGEFFKLPLIGDFAERQANS